MKKITGPVIACFTFFVSHSQNVGIGTSTPAARLHIADSNVLFTGPTTVPVTTIFPPPAQGAGCRMMWYPQTASFRAGIVETSQWDKSNIGRISFASGYNTIASGFVSTAMGSGTTASGYESTAIGSATTASGNNSTAMGYGNSASGPGSTAMGYATIAAGSYAATMGFFNVASGMYSTAMGSGTTASGDYATTMGSGTKASGNYSTAISVGTTASGDCSTSMGLVTIAKSSYSLVTGMFNDTTAINRLFEIGNGTNENSRSNAVTVLTNGNVGIGTTTPNALLQLANTVTNRKIVLYDINNNNHQYYGLGINGGTLRYQIDATVGAHSFYAGVNSTTSNLLFTINGNGNATLTGTLTQSSDARLKTNIHRLQNPLQQLLQLNGYTYNWKDNYRDQELQTGLLAQEVQKIYPQLVKQNEKGELSVNYMGLIPVLIEGIKEQQQQNDQLRLEVNELKQLVRQLLKNK